MGKQLVPQEHKNFPVYIVNADEAEGVVEAIVNVFGIIDLGGDIIHNGAYTKTLNERGNQVKVRVLDSHDTSSIMKVIGKPLEVREIDQAELARLAPEVVMEHPEATGGLYTKTQFLMMTPEGFGAFHRLATKAVDEWSIALDALQTDIGKARTPEGKEITVRNIWQIRLYEYSPGHLGHEPSDRHDRRQENRDRLPEPAACLARFGMGRRRGGGTGSGVGRRRGQHGLDEVRPRLLLA